MSVRFGLAVDEHEKMRKNKMSKIHDFKHHQVIGHVVKTAKICVFFFFFNSLHL